jgi:hypothetical protein
MRRSRSIIVNSLIERDCDVPSYGTSAVDTQS